MKIGIFDPYLDTLSGGEKYMLTAALCLSKEHNVSLFWDTDKKEDIVMGAKERFGMNLSSLLFKQNIFSKNVSLFKRLQESKKYDFIFVLSDGSFPFLLTRLILHFQSPLPWVNGKTLKTRIKMRYVYKVICNSNYTKVHIDTTFGITSSVVYPPITITKQASYKKENYILTVGRYGITAGGSSYKKQEVMIDIFKRMVQEGLKDWKLVVVISVAEQDKVKVSHLNKLASSYPIDIIVNPDNATLWTWYRKAKIYWHAAGFGEDLNIHPDRAEHFGMATVEAMSQGTVPVVINAGGQREIVKNNKNGYVWNTQEEFINYTKKLTQDEKLTSKLSHEAVISTEAFSKDTFCQKITRLIP